MLNRYICQVVTLLLFFVWKNNALSRASGAEMAADRFKLSVTDVYETTA